MPKLRAILPTPSCTAVGESFIRPEMRRAVIVDRDPEMLLRRFKSYVPPAVEKWIGREET